MLSWECPSKAPITGTLTSGPLLLTGGFWVAVAPGDCNEDSAVSLLEHAQLSVCLEGPAGAAPVGDCRCFDVNGNGAVDLADVAGILQAFTGS